MQGQNLQNRLTIEFLRGSVLTILFSFLRRRLQHKNAENVVAGLIRAAADNLTNLDMRGHEFSAQVRFP